MAVKFQKDGYTIEVKTPSPIEDWAGLHESLLDLLHYLDRESITDNFYHIPDLLRAMLPNPQTAKKMKAN